MKKLLILGTVVIGSVVCAFPFRTSCGMVLQVNDTWANTLTPKHLEMALKDLNADACGVYPSKVIVYSSSTSTQH